MAYTAWSVVFGEQPSAAKWNILGANDASFNDGSGLAFTTNNVVPANALKTNAILLGSASITSNFVTTATSAIQVTGLTTGAITIPSGSRKVQIEAYCPNNVLNAIGDIFLSLWDGAVGGTLLAESHITIPATGYGDFQVVKTPPLTVSAGSKTYNVGIRVNANQVTVTVSATSPAFIQALVI